MLASAPALNRSLAQVRPDQKLAEEIAKLQVDKEALRKENVNLLRRQKELELKVELLKGELQVCGIAKKALLSWLQMWFLHTALWNPTGLTGWPEAQLLLVPGDAGDVLPPVWQSRLPCLGVWTSLLLNLLLWIWVFNLSLGFCTLWWKTCFVYNVVHTFFHHLKAKTTFWMLGWKFQSITESLQLLNFRTG